MAEADIVLPVGVPRWWGDVMRVLLSTGASSHKA